VLRLCMLCRPEEIEAEIAAFLQRENSEFNHFRFVFETHGEWKSVNPVLIVSLCLDTLVHMMWW